MKPFYIHEYVCPHCDESHFLRGEPPEDEDGSVGFQCDACALEWELTSEDEDIVITIIHRKADPTLLFNVETVN